MTQDITESGGDMDNSDTEKGKQFRRSLNRAEECMKLCRDLIDPDKYALHVPEAVLVRVYEIFDKDGK